MWPRGDRPEPQWIWIIEAFLDIDEKESGVVEILGHDVFRKFA